MTPKELKAIKQRVASVPRDWAWDRDDEADAYVHQGSHLESTLICLDDTYENAQEHCAFIENAPRDIRALLAEVTKLKREISELKKLNKVFLNNV